MNENSVETKSFIVPQNENELIERLKWFKQQEDVSTVHNYYALGKMIFAFYQKEYGKDKQQKLANETGFSKSTLYKCRQFAIKYPAEKVDELFKGRFPLSWRVVASNLSLEADDFLKHYHEAKTPDELWNALQNSKKSGSAAQTEKPAKEKKIPRTEMEEKIRQYEKLIILKDEEIDDLKAQNEKLQNQIRDLMAINAVTENFEMVEMAETA
ncbi:MAG: hypothetical protein H6Q49_1780 [Deltaproteobacteria bacterium]|nr:hypothetical protein [Deltaproteobacteria bacterium]